MIKKSFFSCILFALMGLLCNAQQEMAKELDGRIKQEQLLLKEKIYVHSDKNFYLAGEIVWFKIYCLDGNDHRLLNTSKVAYAEILDRNNKPVLQAKIALAGKGGVGSFYLPLTLASGHYTLRAYTNWMKNAGNTAFFEKTISIVNTMRPPPVNRSNDVFKAYADFFPEGGQLVEDIETKCAFRIISSNGRGTDARGIVIDNGGDTVVRFSPHRFGIGYFLLKPQPGKTYKAVILLPGGNFIEQPLPVPKKYGYVMNVADEGSGWKIKLNAKAEPGQAAEELFLVAFNHQTVKLSYRKEIVYGQELVFHVERSQLGEGISNLTLFNKDHQPVCERLVFSRPAIVPAGITSDKGIYNTRQPVDLSFAIKEDGAGDLSDCSVSVYQSDSLQESNGINIISYLSFISELKGTIESPGYYFSNEPGVEQATDNLMLTHGWRRFSQDKAADQKKAAAFKFIPEYRGHAISGRVINVATGSAVANADCSLSVPSAPFGFYPALSDSLGNVSFETKDYYGPGEIIAQVDAHGQTDAKYRVDINSPFSDEPIYTTLPPFSLSAKMGDRLLQKSISMQAQNIYVADSIRKFDLPLLADTLPFYGHAEYRYLLDDYKRFTTMEEVLREYVTPINVVLHRGQLQMSVFDETVQEVYRANMLVLLDGVPIADYNKMFSYDPLKIKKLEVVPRRYMYRARYYFGIASFETYDGRFDGFALDPGLIAVDYEGLQLQREFYSPRYDGNAADNRIPDLRTTLYWAPQLMIDKQVKTNLKFYTSDQKGKFIVVIEGITQNGKPVFASSSFEVQ